MSLQASHAVSLAWLGLSRPRFSVQLKVPDLRVLVNQPGYTSQARITEIALKHHTQQQRISVHKLYCTDELAGLAGSKHLCLKQYVYA
jgi:hypothetical protein